ncbi:FmdB family transcriptional regulator [Cellulomonas sp. APG4]|uniref:FmdB family zinc ribbon protein n=1 Tax=Cellulomonas sp. APG4 TaxID=1538656 RepID=UPI0013797A55|nr:FmdB family transcriptional regulator [Cellulomonas sp. APG4]
MPTYAYACTVCDHRFDVQQSFSDDALTTCPECSGHLRKLFSSVGVVFKGSGFYRTDSRADRKGGSSSSGSGGSSSKDSSSSKDGSSSTSSASTGSTNTGSASTSGSTGSSSGSSTSTPSAAAS